MSTPASPHAPRVAVVTGGGSGIGRAVSLRLADAGFTVLACGRSEDPLRDLAAENPGIATRRCDVTDEDDVAALFADAGARFGRVDVLVNNAGTFGPTVSIDEMDVSAWQATVDVNLTGAMLCAREAFRMMRRQHPAGGRIINNGSISAQVPRPHSAAYAASKAGMTGLTKALALDGRPHGISCGQIDVGNAATGILDSFGASTGALQPDGTRRPEPSFDVRHVADAIVWMAGLPASATVDHLTLTATGMPFIGRG